MPKRLIFPSMKQSPLSTMRQVPEEDMWRTFNMGIGLVVVIGAADAQAVCEDFQARDIAYYDIGRIVKGNQSVVRV